MGKKSRQKREEKLARRMDSQLLGRFASARQAEGVACVVRNQTELPKLSARVRSLVADTLQRLGNLDQKRVALIAAVLAWNRAVVRSAPSESLGDAARRTDQGLPPDIQGLVVALEKRKMELYPDDHRIVMDYEVRNLGGELRFSVVTASTEPS
jgi:hypothetical protein